MKRILVAILGTLILATGLVATTAATATADHKNYYGDSSRAVAKHIGCKNWYRTPNQAENGGSGAYNKDSGTCRLKGKRVSLITFHGPGQQREWNAGAKFALPSNHWWANGKGALVTARNGNKAAARVGAKALPGRLVKAY